MLVALFSCLTRNENLRFHNRLPSQSVKEAAAAPGPTVTVKLVTLILNGELVVISELFTTINFAQCKDDNVLLAFHIDNARVAVWFTGVVNKTGCVSMHGGINNVKVINPEHVAANPLQHRSIQDVRVKTVFKTIYFIQS